GIRDFHVTGVQTCALPIYMLAVLTQPDRTAQLRALRVPAAVVHGPADRMIHVSRGRATAHAIPDAELVTVEGMGHDLPAELYETFVEVIRRTAIRAGDSRLRATVDTAPISRSAGLEPALLLLAGHRLALDVDRSHQRQPLHPHGRGVRGQLGRHLVAHLGEVTHDPDALHDDPGVG